VGVVVVDKAAEYNHGTSQRSRSRQYPGRRRPWATATTARSLETTAVTTMYGKRRSGN
jgi:uridine phosphorylase